jgi:hypothetical protein
MYLSSNFGNTVTNCEAAGEGHKRYKTPGAYLKPAQPEGSAFVYFWNGGGFAEV